MTILRLLLAFAAAGAAGGFSVRAASADPRQTRDLIAIARSPEAALADRARACQQLAIIGTPEAVPVLAALLADEKLGQYARDGLEAIADPSAGEALRAALGRFEGNLLVGVINSLGVKRDAQAVAALVRIARGTADAPAVAALGALGKIATPDAMAALQTMLAHQTDVRRFAAAEGLLVAAERVARQGGAGAAPLYDAVRQATLPVPLRAAAVRGSILARGDAGLPLLIEQLRAPEEAMRDIALRAARELSGAGVAARLIAELDRLPAPTQALLLAALVDRGGPEAVAALEARATAEAAEVRHAALAGLGKIGRAASVPFLLRAAAAGRSPVETAAAFASLGRIQAPDTDDAILRAIPSAPPALKVRFINLLGERSAPQAAPALLALTADADPEIAKAAWRTLGLVAKPGDLPALIRLAIAAPDEASKTLADRAIVTTSMKVLAPEQRADAVLAAMRAARDPATKAALLRPLGAIVRSMGGSHGAFFAVKSALKEAEPVRSAALQCLADWPTAAPATTLIEVATKADAPAAERDVALRGAVRLATNVATGRERSPLDVVDVLTRANRVVRSKDEKLMIVSGLGHVKRPEAVALLEPYLDDPAVKPEAALALVQIGTALANPKTIPALPPLLERIAASDSDDDVRRKAARLAKGTTPPAPVKGKAARTAAATAPAAGSPPLFNGTDLGNWDGDPGVWRVQDGVIVGGSLEGNPRNEFLATTRRFRNFVLRLEYQLEGTEGFVNGGVQFRSVRIPQPPNEMSGYQADIGAGHSGCLYDESRRRKFLARAPDEQIKRLEKPGAWNRLEIRCEGARVELSLNGEQTVTFTEEDASVGRDGLVALQIHGNCKAEIRFRNLALEELP